MSRRRRRGGRARDLPGQAIAHQRPRADARHAALPALPPAAGAHRPCSPPPCREQHGVPVGSGVRRRSRVGMPMLIRPEGKRPAPRHHRAAAPVAGPSGALARQGARRARRRSAGAPTQRGCGRPGAGDRPRAAVGDGDRLRLLGRSRGARAAGVPTASAPRADAARASAADLRHRHGSTWSGVPFGPSPDRLCDEEPSFRRPEASLAWRTPRELKLGPSAREPSPAVRDGSASSASARSALPDSMASVSSRSGPSLGAGRRRRRIAPAPRPLAVECLRCRPALALREARPDPSRSRARGECTRRSTPAAGSD